MQRYPRAIVWEEIAFLAYHLHWSLDDLLDLDHHQRADLVHMVAGIHHRARQGAARG